MSRMSKQREALVREANKLRESGIFLDVRQNAEPMWIEHKGVWSKYATVAHLVDVDGRVRASGIALCGMDDQPNRKLGWNIAVGRCLAEFRKREARA